MDDPDTGAVEHSSGCETARIGGAAATSTRMRDRVARLPLSMTTFAILFALGVVKDARRLGRPFTPVGDVAYIEIGVRQAITRGNALGVYSRFGWHHPGPALFYLLAPVYWLSGNSSRSLFLGAWLINGLCALGAIWIVRTRAGEPAARLMAALLFVCVLVLGFVHLNDAWNPKVLAFPLLLLMVSAAAACSGSAWAFVVAAVTASALVQIHVGTLPVSLAMLALAAVGFGARHLRRDHDERRRAALRVPALLAVGLLGVMWIGPFVQQVTGHDGNLEKIAHFYAHPSSALPTSHSLSSSFVVISNRSTPVVLGNPKDAHGHRSRLLAAGALAALGLCAAVLARRRSPFLAALALTTTIGLGVGVLAATRVVGPQDAYLFYWTETLPLPALVAAVALALDRVRIPAAVVTALGLIGLLIASVVTVVRSNSIPLGDAPGARAITARIEHALPSRHQPFTLRIDGAHVDAGGLAVQFDKDGYHFRLVPTTNLYSGSVAANVAGPTFVLRAATPAPVVVPGERRIATMLRVAIFESG